jgi:hypothetical protein
MQANPVKELEWLKRLLGDWISEAECHSPETGESSMVRGTEHVRQVGDLWVIAEGRGEMPGGAPMTSIMSLGFNPQTNRFVGTWLGSMMAHLWVYDGFFGDNENILNLDSEGPDFSSEGKMAKYRDSIEFKSADYRTLTAYLLGDDGQWTQLMTSNFYRKK